MKRREPDRTVRLLGDFTDETRMHSHNLLYQFWCQQHHSLPPHDVPSRNIRHCNIQSICIQVMLFYSQQHIQLTCRHNFHCHHNVELLLSGMHLVICSNCHMTIKLYLTDLSDLLSFALRSMEVCSTLLSELNSYENQRNTNHLEING